MAKRALPLWLFIAALAAAGGARRATTKGASMKGIREGKGWVWLCALILAVGNAGCASMKTEPTLAPEPITVHIEAIEGTQDCKVDPDYVDLDYGNPTYPGTRHYEVLWLFAKGADETGVVSSKPVEDQDPDDRPRGWDIKTLIDDKFLGAGTNEVRSGKPKHKPPFKNMKGVEWEYNVEIFKADGTRKCFADPGLCYRTPDGGAICH